ncbi:recombinase family protein [Jiella pelagia]|uniref:Recombinase family protein n=1 Tax=Jiella pelagia TaxID=2986949 RepID=A0ABY7BSZ5_9HYPH|nr:recombinase family protein [Jiella pelagia]WAP66734.1 recombinase family protein [Jiella pelagia]
MSRTFAYARVSTLEQTTENQLGEIRAAGFSLQARRIITETISGSHTAMERPGFARLIDRLEEGDILVVTKLDRLGRNAMDVRKTVDHLAEQGIKVHCLALGGVDLTSAAGRMTMGVINAVAEFERDLLIERTNAGLKRARAEGKAIGRPPLLSDAKKRDVLTKLDGGISIAKLAREYDVSRITIARIRDARVKLNDAAGSGEGAHADPA